MDNGRPPLKEEQGGGFRSVPIYADGYRWPAFYPTNGQSIEPHLQGDAYIQAVKSP